MQFTASLVRVKTKLFPVLALFLLACSLSARPPTEADIARLAPWFAPAEFAEPKLSPTGEYLGFILRDGENYAIGIFDFATRKLSFAGGSGKMVPIDFWWKGPRRLLARLVATDGKSTAHTAFDIDGGNPEVLKQLTESAGLIIDALPAEPDHILRAHFGELTTGANSGLAVNTPEVFRFNLRNGRSTTVAGNLGRVDAWIVDRKLQVRGAFSHVGEGARRWYWRTTSAGEWRSLRLEPDMPGFRPIGFDADDRYLWVWDFTVKPSTRLSKFDTHTGELVPGPIPPAGVEPTLVMILGNTRQPVAVVYTHTVPVRIEPLNESWRPAVERLQKGFAGYTPTIIDQLPNGHWVVSAENSRFPGGYFLFDPKTGGVTPIASMFNPGLKEGLFVPATPVAVPSRHGFTINGKVWLPRGVKQPPVIVLCPSALPATPSPDTFNAYTQAYVAGGYAVAQFDGRGTMGYGRDFEILFQGSPSEVLREDMEDGVAGLAGQGVVDGRRPVLFGYGLGGALALSAAEQSSVFRAVVSMNAPIKVDQYDLLNLSDNSSFRALTEKLGWGKSIKVAEALSPLEVAPRLKIPSLHLMNEARWTHGKMSDDAKKLERAVKKSSLAKVDLAYSWFQGFTPPSIYARDRASAVLRTLAFYDEALATP